MDEDFKKLQHEMGVSFPHEKTWSELWLYISHLRKWSTKINLISPGDVPLLATKHLRQALMMVPIIMSLPNRVILDLGSGAGLPAIPLKIAFPNSHFILVESRRKRANFLREIVRSIGLHRIDVVNERIENWQGIDGGVDLVTARAVAAPNKMIELVRDHLAPYGWVLTPLSERAIEGVDLRWRVHKDGFGTTLGLFH